MAAKQARYLEENLRLHGFRASDVSNTPLEFHMSFRAEPTVHDHLVNS